jgi:ADP-dependent NAD(P)H-hydrate dehydratase / NAD(P)H-hydrate epimerase
VTPLVTRHEMQVLEQRAVALGSSWDALMQQAAAGVAATAAELLRDHANPQVLVLAGPGNNGGDALTAARMLAGLGVHVSLLRFQRADDRLLQLLRAEPALYDLGVWPLPDSVMFLQALQQADLVLDGLLGTAGRPPETALRTLIELLNAHRRPAPQTHVLAIDLPSGVNADDGRVPTVAVRADLTVACGLIKRGTLFAPARDFAGRLVTVPLGLPAADLAALPVRRLSAAVVAPLLPVRPRDGHKITFGRVAVLAGSLQYPGAAVLAATAVLRSGAGLVTLAAPLSALMLMTLAPELTLLPLELPAGEPDSTADDAALQQLFSVARAGLIGPGLGRTPAGDARVCRLLGLIDGRRPVAVGFVPLEPREPLPALPPCVIDADGLNLLADLPDWSLELPPDRLVLTPHPGEMRRLIGADLPVDRVETARAAAQRWRQTIVLKGDVTVVAAPDGRAAVLDAPNPALATAGSGDVLAGTIAGLLAQGCAPYDAACLGVVLHSLAAARVAAALGSAGALAGDLLSALPLARRAVAE